MLFEGSDVLAMKCVLSQDSKGLLQTFISRLLRGLEVDPWYT
jgi:hypothetical protein